MLSKLFIVFCISSVVLAKGGSGGNGGGQGDRRGPGGRGGPGGHGGSPPLPFLQNVTNDARKAFFDIVSNENLTQTEVESQSAAWANTYGVSELYNEFQQNKTALDNEIKTNVSSVIGNLANVNTQLSSIFSNKDQTRAQIKTAVDAIRENYPVEVDTIMHLSHPGPPGGGPGGPGGRDGPRGHGGFGGNNSTASTKAAKKAKKNNSSSR